MDRGLDKVRSTQAAWYKPAASDRSRRDYRGYSSTREDAPRLRRGSPSTGVQRDKFSFTTHPPYKRNFDYGFGVTLTLSLNYLLRGILGVFIC